MDPRERPGDGEAVEIGGVLSWLLFEGYEAAKFNRASFRQVVFAFRVTPEILTRETVVALVIGAVGGLFPGVAAVGGHVLSLAGIAGGGRGFGGPRRGKFASRVHRSKSGLKGTP